MIEKQTLKFASFWLYWPAKVFPIVILQNIYQTPFPSFTAVSDINDNINNKNDNTALLIGLSVSLVLVLILLVIVILLLVGYNKRWEKRSDFNNGEFTSIWFYENVIYFFYRKRPEFHVYEGPVFPPSEGTSNINFLNWSLSNHT